MHRLLQISQLIGRVETVAGAGASHVGTQSSPSNLNGGNSNSWMDHFIIFNLHATNSPSRLIVRMENSNITLSSSRAFLLIKAHWSTLNCHNLIQSDIFRCIIKMSLQHAFFLFSAEGIELWCWCDRCVSDGTSWWIKMEKINELLATTRFPHTAKAATTQNEVPLRDTRFESSNKSQLQHRGGGWELSVCCASATLISKHIHPPITSSHFYSKSKTNNEFKIRICSNVWKWWHIASKHIHCCPPRWSIFSSVFELAVAPWFLLDSPKNISTKNPTMIEASIWWTPVPKLSWLTFPRYCWRMVKVTSIGIAGDVVVTPWI